MDMRDEIRWLISKTAGQPAESGAPTRPAKLRVRQLALRNLCLVDIAGFRREFDPGQCAELKNTPHDGRYALAGPRAMAISCGGYRL